MARVDLTTKPGARSPLTDPNNILSRRSIFYEYDSYDVKDESPSFAPNGRIILLATVNTGRGVLSAVSADGRIKQRLTISAGDVREPAWGPFVR